VTRQGERWGKTIIFAPGSPGNRLKRLIPAKEIQDQPRVLGLVVRDGRRQSDQKWCNFIGVRSGGLV